MAECANLPRIRNNGGLNTDTAEVEQMLVMAWMRQRRRRKMEDEERKAKDETKERKRTLEKARIMIEKGE